MKIKLLFLFISIAFTTTAQTNEGVKTLFGNGIPHLGYFISPLCQVGQIAGSTAIVPGVGAGVVLNKNIYLGLVYKFIATENTPSGETDNTLYLDQKWGGIKCEYAVSPDKVVHLNFPLEAGISHIELDKKDSYSDRGFTLSDNDASFAYVEPGVALEINMHSYVKLNFTAGYRFVSDVAFRSVTGKDLTGLNCSISLKIGIF
jgi:hypothetical protein